MQVIRKLLYCSVLIAGMPASANAAGCPDIEQPPAQVCLASDHGLAYADTEQDAQTASQAQAEAVERFASYFGGPMPSGIVVLSATFDPLEARRLARRNGLDYALVWLSPSEKRRMTARAMRRAGLDRVRSRRTSAKIADQSLDTLRHEIGHSLYSARYWPHAPDNLGERYGSPAPDWLDEAAAVLMESMESQGARAVGFLAATQSSSESVPSLSEFLRMDHPILSPKFARRLSRGVASKSGVQMMVADDVNMAGIGTFYGQSLLVATFLIEATGEPRILAKISAAIADGHSFSDWLAKTGPSYGLPGEPERLQDAWEDWSQALSGQADTLN